MSAKRQKKRKEKEVKEEIEHDKNEKSTTKKCRPSQQNKVNLIVLPGAGGKFAKVF